MLLHRDVVVVHDAHGIPARVPERSTRLGRELPDSPAGAACLLTHCHQTVATCGGALRRGKAFEHVRALVSRPGRCAQHTSAATAPDGVGWQYCAAGAAKTQSSGRQACALRLENLQEPSSRRKRRERLQHGRRCWLLASTGDAAAECGTGRDARCSRSTAAAEAGITPESCLDEVPAAGLDRRQGANRRG